MFKRKAAKNFKLIGVIALIFIAAIAGYYVLHLKQGKYKASAFHALVIKWGVGDTLQNSYNSETGHYQYLDNKDRLVHKNFKLRSNDVIYLNSKFNEFDIWSLPNLIANSSKALKDPKVLRYEITINYDGHLKKIVHLADFDGNSDISYRITTLEHLVVDAINLAENRYTK